MRILFVNPPDKNTLVGNNPEIIDSERGFNPPLGIMYLASYVLDKTSHDVKIVDCQAEELDFDDLKKIIKSYNPDIVGVSMMTFTILDSLGVAKIAKETNENVKVIAGGPHPHIFPVETLELNDIDYIVLGEGESVIVDLVNNAANPEKLKDTPGVGFNYNGKVIVNPPKGLIEDLDSIPFPARKLTKYEKYYSLLAKRSPATTMITSRGCPYKCIFCDRPHLGKVFRARSTKNVVDEMEECCNMGIKEILVYDDTFTIDRQRVIDICREIRRRKLDIGWDIRARVNTVDKEVLWHLKKAGCERIHYGVESGNQRILNVLKKGITLKQVARAFRLTKKMGISTLGYFMIGSPTETRETILQTIRFACRLDCDYAHFTITTPFPSTALYRDGLKNGTIKSDYWREFAKNPTSDFKPPFLEEKLSRDEIIELIKYAYKKFYRRPSYILKRLVKIRSFEELKRKVKAGLKVLSL